MSRGKYVLLIPSQISPRGVEKLARELRSNRVTIAGKDANLILAKWDDHARATIAKGPSIQAAYVDKISPAAIRRLPPSVARIGVLWNWSIDKRGRHVSDGQVKRLMEKLRLEEKRGQAYDRLAKKYLGKIQQGEEEEGTGNWCIRQIRGWYRIPGFLGFWEKLWCMSRTYTNGPPCSGPSLVMDFIQAEVAGPQHFYYHGKYNGSIAYAYDWDYIWIGESHCGWAYSYARIGGSTASISRDIC